jgi:FAD/FMN-containing dehydrogenase
LLAGSRLSFAGAYLVERASANRLPLRLGSLDVDFLLCMNRRTFIQRLAALPALSALWRFLPASTHAASTKLSTTRVRPTDPGWPTPASWQKLNQRVGGRLIKVESPLVACEGASDSAACQEILKNLKNPFYLGDQPGATQISRWVDAWTSAPSVYAIAATTTDDVVAGVNFARENNLRLVVKGGGHSFQGTSNAADSLLIWTRAMKKIILHDAFVGQGCDGSQSPQRAVTIESGAMWIDAYQAVTTEADRYVQGGGCTTVGVAGLVQSGGFGSFSKRYGTAAAGLLEAEIVTADGAIRTANACTNSDLFWAIKGGGGGSMGVLTKLTLRTRDLPDSFGIVFATIEATSDAGFHDLVSRFVSFYNHNLFNPHWGEIVSLRPNNTLVITMLFQGLTQQDAEAVWKPFFDSIKNSGQQYTIKAAPYIRSYDARHQWDADFLRNAPGAASFDSRPGAPKSHFWWAYDQNDVGMYCHGFESAWLPQELLQENQQGHLVDALFSASRHWGVDLDFKKGLAGAPPEEIAAARDTATNPAVLTAFALAIIAGGKSSVYPGIPNHEPDLTTARQDASKIDQAMYELRKIVPDPGSYVSESNYFNRSWQQTFWGPNYSRLRAIKDKYDLTGLFFVHHGVGSEDWSADGFTRLV